MPEDILDPDILDNDMRKTPVENLHRVPHMVVKLLNGQASHIWNVDLTMTTFLRGYSEKDLLGADEVVIPWSSLLHGAICQRCRMGLSCGASSAAGLVRPS